MSDAPHSLLPADIQAGDYIEVGMLGAYGAAMKTRFNGFGESHVVEVEDEPMASQYRGGRRDRHARAPRRHHHRCGRRHLRPACSVVPSPPAVRQERPDVASPSA